MFCFGLLSTLCFENHQYEIAVLITQPLNVYPKVGFSFLLDASGKLFKPHPKKPNLRDVEGNVEAIYAVMCVSKGSGHFSSHILKEALLQFYTSADLFPVGITADMAVIQTWALRQGLALQRLVT